MGRNPGAGPIQGEICAGVEAMRTAAGTTGVELRPPMLMLGTSERVGSNWLSDTLRPLASQHNEPFRQQLAPDHGLSALNPHPGRCTAETLGTLGWHWLVTFAASKHSERRQVVKETNLFFALPTLSALFRQAPVAVLTRSPLGVASSFTRSDLRPWPSGTSQ
jgi:hypothetical protein